MSKKVLITGICGFVGSTLALSWLESGDNVEIIGMDNFIRQGSERNRIILKNRGIELIHGDIRNSSDFETIPKVDWVIDCAANPSVMAGIDGKSSSRQLLEHNLFGTVNMLELCKRHGSGFILLSTSRVYSISEMGSLPVIPLDGAFSLDNNFALPAGVTASGISEKFSTDPPLSLYGSTKLASETIALEYGETFGFPVWINRCGVLAGAGQFGRADQGIFAYWINSWIKRKPLKYIGFGGTGYQVRDALHPKDLISLLLKQTSTEYQTSVKTVNLGGGSANSISLANLSLWCRERYGEHEVFSIPDIRPFDIPWLIMDSSLANHVWNWEPQTPLQSIFEEIALHAETNPDWLEVTGG